MDRRRFVKALPVMSAGAAGAAGAGLGLGGCVSTRYVMGREQPDRLVVDRALFDEAVDVMVQNRSLPAPVYLRTSGGSGFTAVLARCTHRGCQPEPGGDRLVCPCHGSEFGFDGGVLQGPAERSLDRFAVTLDGDDVVVWLNREPAS